MNSTNLLLGAHFSIAKGLHGAVYQAKAYHCNALQMFTKNATTWKERMVAPAEQERFELAKAETGIHAIFSHTSYLINLASPDSKKQTMNQFDAVLGLDQLFAIHVNDSKKDLGSRVDRHTHIGKGALGENAFKHLLNDERLLHVPKLLETAKAEDGIDWDQRNLDLLRSLNLSNKL